jgi:NADH-ubiquinone oxidoreductase chain 3
LDLEVFLVFPYAVSSYNNGGYGLWGLLIFLFVVTLGFIFELGKGALNIYSK